MWLSCIPTNRIFLFPQLFSYPSIGAVGGMSGVISPTNLSLFSSPVTVNSPRSNRHSTGTIQPRWNTQSAPSAPQPFITLDEDYMMTPLIAGTTAEANGSLMDDGEWLPHLALFLSVACPGAEPNLASFAPVFPFTQWPNQFLEPSVLSIFSITSKWTWSAFTFLALRSYKYLSWSYTSMTLQTWVKSPKR